MYYNRDNYYVKEGYFMKKLIALILSSLLLFSLVACRKNQDKSTTLEETTTCETTTIKTTTEESSLEVETTDDTYSEYDEIYYNDSLDGCKYVLDAMVNKDMDTLLCYSGHADYEGETDMYDFFKDIDIDKYVIDKDNYIHLDTVRDIIPVTLYISKSDNEMFPVGESEWNFSIIYTAFESVIVFENTAETPKVHIDLPKDNYKYINAVDFCYNLTNYFGESIYDKTQQGKIIDFEYKPQYIDSCATSVINFLQSVGYLKDYADYTVENITNGFEKMIGTVGCDLTLDKSYKKDSNTLDSQHLGAWWSSATLNEETYNKDDDTYTIVIDWWADNMFMVKARTIKYTVSQIEDNQFKLISLEYLYDSKYKNEGGSD